MALKTLVLFSLLALGQLVPKVVQTCTEESPAKDFQRQHMDPGHFPNNGTYCNRMMYSRNMTHGFCKKFNTFVHESKADVDAVCRERNVTCKNGMGNCHKSKYTMRITDCSTECPYLTESKEKRIIIACAGHPPVPVHFDRYV
ncbi:PREDICTED: ribonuclease pancreatic-like [Condylura cristata]|uniref:ribonuclease pancreatic-like n=1 Tax=Condylura cristata TaxID=143302 RepID=UPI0003347EFC|nr:PREDICTED: ribonuclease pancreatic-like [Condylura cristata]